MTKLSALVLVTATLAGCSDDVQPSRNPDKVWLALDGSEVQVRLIPVEPPPF
jgi:hypothetical protein